MRVTVTGASGLIGSALVASLQSDGAEVSVTSRNPAAAQAKLGVPAFAWDPLSERAPAAALAGRDAIVHLAGENIARRWSAQAREAIRQSRVTGTRHLVAGLRALGTDRDSALPPVLVSGSAIGYYGAHGDEPLDEDAPAGGDFLAQTCVAWEAEARIADELGMRVVEIRTGVVLAHSAGALAKMLLPFRLGLGGPVAGGHQFVSWIHRDDVVALIRTAIERDSWSGPVNATAPEPVTNRELSRTLGRLLHRPSLLPVPALALRLIYGEAAQLLTAGARVLPAKALVLGYQFRHPHLEEALRSALA